MTTRRCSTCFEGLDITATVVLRPPPDLPPHVLLESLGGDSYLTAPQARALAAVLAAAAEELERSARR